MSVVPIRKDEAEAQSKTVAANQKAVDDLPLDTGTWRVDGVPGLYLRCRKQSKTFFIQRRVRGRLVKETVGALSVKQAKAAAMRKWTDLKPKPAAAEVATLSTAIEAFLAEKALAPRTIALYRYNADRYLAAWKKRALSDIGEDRAGVRRLQSEITAQYGAATANQVLRLLSAVYRWRRGVDAELPESPTVAVKLAKIAARDWALTDDELKAWWSHKVKPKGARKAIAKGVSTLSTLKRMWWMTALFTGARKGSIEALRWADVDLKKKTIHFRVAKGGRAYIVPMCDRLAAMLEQYRRGEEAPPSEWVFPSNRIDGEHIGDVKNTAEGVPPAHKLRHTFRTTLAQIGATPDQARMLMGHSMGNDVSRGYISTPLVVESMRPVTNAVAKRYIKILGW